jgi:hypothetical protein
MVSIIYSLIGHIIPMEALNIMVVALIIMVSLGFLKAKV